MLQTGEMDRPWATNLAKKVQAELRELGLPTLPEIKDAVEKKAEELGVK